VQAVSVFEQHPSYDLAMPKGRPSKRPRSQFGERLASARERMGLSQVQLAEKLGVSQKVITYWERNEVALRSDQLTAIAAAVNVTTEELLGQPKPKVRSGPTGKMRQVFEAVSQLPRKQQQKVIEMAEGFLALHLTKSREQEAAK
jgi:transcriptional regulator with XRE-family HTH domain